MNLGIGWLLVSSAGLGVLSDHILGMQADAQGHVLIYGETRQLWTLALDLD